MRVKFHVFLEAGYYSATLIGPLARFKISVKNEILNIAEFLVTMTEVRKTRKSPSIDRNKVHFVLLDSEGKDFFHQWYFNLKHPKKALH